MTCMPQNVVGWPVRCRRVGVIFLYAGPFLPGVLDRIRSLSGKLGLFSLETKMQSPLGLQFCKDCLQFCFCEMEPNIFL